MSGVSSSQANAESYGVGCLVDNVPTTCKKVMDHLEKERAQKLQVIGPASTSFITRLLMSVTAGAAWVPVGPKKLIRVFELKNGKAFKVYSQAVERWTYYIVAPGWQKGFDKIRRPHSRRTLLELLR